MISVQIRKGSARNLSEVEVEIYIDEDGLSNLTNQLKFLSSPNEHVHFMSESWGVGTLSEQIFADDDKDVSLVHHLRITRVKE